VKGDDLHLTGLVAAVDGARFIRKEARGPASEAESFGTGLADDVLDSGGREILEEVYQREIT
jgi:hydroxymethylbilane synthase